MSFPQTTAGSGLRSMCKKNMIIRKYFATALATAMLLIAVAPSQPAARADSVSASFSIRLEIRHAIQVADWTGSAGLSGALTGTGSAVTVMSVAHSGLSGPPAVFYEIHQNAGLERHALKRVAVTTARALYAIPSQASAAESVTFVVIYQ